MTGRVGRSLQLSEEGKEKAQKALTGRCLTQKELAKELKISRETVSKFFRGLSVDRKYFVEICDYLALEWDEVTDKPTSQAVQEKKQQDSTLDIDALVREVRQKRHDKIQDQCRTMRLLDISQPVALADIYTDVNILEKITSDQRRDISDFVKGFNPELDNFNRLGLGEVRQQRVPGLDAVSRYSKLIVLGKPGAGKTTFLQWLAIKCDLGEFQSEKVPIFIRLKNFAEDTRRDDSNYRFLNYISEEFASCGIADKSVTETILTQGKALILLDGLDEVSEEDDDKFIEKIRRFVNTYYRNYYIITCRIAAKKYRFWQENFTDVEVADFAQNQVEAFAKKWFLTVNRNDEEESEASASWFLEKLKQKHNQEIRELAVTPILLNLTCLVFQEKGEFPSKRFKLYEQGLDILLRKWDACRGIIRDEVYRNLSLEHKIELLSQVGAIFFERNSYFFEQDKLEQYIADYLRNLYNHYTDRAILQRDSRAVLKSIEAQHGLVVERAQGVYSFSHLTFQEYFTAKNFVVNPNEEVLKQLISGLRGGRWREVFLLVGEILFHTDDLLRFKPKIDGLLASDEKIQQFLSWVHQKSLSVQAPYKTAAVRAFYLGLALPPCNNHGHYSSTPFDFSLARRLDHNLDLAHESRLHFALALDFALASAFQGNFIRMLDLSPDSSLETELATELQDIKNTVVQRNQVRKEEEEDFYVKNKYLIKKLTDLIKKLTDLIKKLTNELEDLDKSIFSVIDRNLLWDDIKPKDFNDALYWTRKILVFPEEVKKVIPSEEIYMFSEIEEYFSQLYQEYLIIENNWQAKIQFCTDKIKFVLKSYRNLSYDWQFSEDQKKLINQYYDANILLAECLKNSEASSKEQHEIEESLLLPIAEIEKRQQRMTG